MTLDNKTVGDIKNMIEATAQFREEGGEKLARMTTRMDEIEARFSAPDNGSGGRKSMNYGNQKTVGSRMIEQAEEMRKSIGTTRRYIFQVGAMFAPSEEKSVVDSAALGFSTPGILNAQRVSDGVITLPRRKLTIRDLLRSKSVTTGQVDWLKEVSFTSGASPQTESSAKGESTFDLDIVSTKIATIAHFANVSKQALDDLPELRRYIDESMMYYLRLKEEIEFLFGDNLGSHLNGIATQAVSYAGTYAAGTDNKIDKLRHYILELENADEACTGFVLSPTDWHAIELSKTEPGGANTGSYLVGDPNAPGSVLNVPTLWGRPVIVSRSMPANRALAGDFSKAFIADRMDATIDLGLENGTNFEKNLATVRCENRTAICVGRPSAFRFGII